MKYSDLIDYWLESNSKPVDFKTDKRFPALKLHPDKINSFLNAYDAMDLYSNPSSSPARDIQDYQSEAVNLDGSNFDNKQRIFFSNGRPSSSLSMIGPYRSDYSDIPRNLHSRIPEAIYQHELSHAQDERIDHEKGAPYPFKDDAMYIKYLANKAREFVGIGAKKRAWSIARREAPAMAAEDMFWANLMEN